MNISIKLGDLNSGESFFQIKNKQARKKISITLMLSIAASLSFFLPTIVVSNELSESEAIFNWVEKDYFQYFSPAGKESFHASDYFVRYYNESDTYIGTKDGQLYVYGAVFDGLLPLGSISQWLPLATESTSIGKENTIDLIGILKTENIPNDMQIVGNYAYLTFDSGSKALLVVDISTPASPTIIGSVSSIVSGNAFGGGTSSSGFDSIQVEGDVAYVTAGNTLYTIDISTPSLPTIKDKRFSGNTFNYDSRVLRSGKYVYVPDGRDGVKIIDISIPEAPILVNTLVNTVNEFDASAIFIKDSYAYIVNPYGELQIADISSPEFASIIGSADLGAALSPGRLPTISVKGNYAYVTNEVSLNTFDISSPSSPIYVNTNFGLGTFVDINIAGNYAYVASNSTGIQVLNISDPNSPKVVIPNALSARYTSSIEIVNNYAYAMSKKGLDIYRLNTLTMEPANVGFINTPGNAVDIAVSGNYAYVADGREGLQIIDITTPSNPIIKNTVNTLGIATVVKVIGNYAYVVNDASDLHIINISQPESPIIVAELGSLSNSERSSSIDITVADNYVYLVNSNEMIIIDVGIITAPVVVRTLSDSDYIKVSIVENYAYAIDYSESILDIIDISIPGSAEVVGRLKMEREHILSRASEIFVKENYAYITASLPMSKEENAGYGMAVIDIRSASHPIFFKYIRGVGGLLPAVNMDVENIHIDGDYAYTAGGFRGIGILDISTPESPLNVGTVAITENLGGSDRENAHDVTIQGEYAYVASGRGVRVVALP
ncbi:MAG: hypothetical protein methR_P2268 [Methyloprofundus sp.]|nr:MAG: hypothetical protein methR_P2268 [Methyloprofundus sp.]